MTSEEKYIKQHVGMRNPFRVPEGYFEGLAPEVMAKLSDYPDRQLILQKSSESNVKSMLVRLRPLFYAAATLVIAVFCVSVYLESSNSEGDEQLTSQSIANDTYYDDVADYFMVDNADIYACLTND